MASRIIKSATRSSTWRVLQHLGTCGVGGVTFSRVTMRLSVRTTPFSLYLSLANKSLEIPASGCKLSIPLSILYLFVFIMCTFDHIHPLCFCLLLFNYDRHVFSYILIIA